MTDKLVRYISPFGSPAWMPRDAAQVLLEADERRWDLYEKYDLLTEEQRQVGAPRIVTIK